MMQSEFETLTGIYLDVPAYEAAEHEYNTGDYASKAEFCDCFKADEDALAHKIQTAANKRWFGLTDQRDRLIVENEKLQKENDRLQKENENLSIEIMKLGEHVDELQKQVSELPEPATLEATDVFSAAEIEKIRAAMQRSLHAAACDDCTGDEILHMVWGFDYLLSALGVE